jgi:hypothetical protein
MDPLSSLLRFALVALAGWVNQQQREVIDYLQEENRALREQIGPGRLRFTDDQRRRLAAKAKTLGRRLLRDIAQPRPVFSISRRRQSATRPHSISDPSVPNRVPYQTERVFRVLRRPSLRDLSGWDFGEAA